MPAARLLKDIPGPKGHWFWGSLQERREDPLHLFLRVHQQYGDVVRLRMGPTVSLLSLTHPEHLKHVLVDHNARYHKGFGLSRARPLLGNGLLLSEGDFWKRQRRLAQPAFHKERLAALATTMVEATSHMLSRWQAHPTSQPLDIAAEMMRLTLAIVGRTLFSTDVSGEADRVGRAATLAIEETNRRILSLFLLPLSLPTQRNRAFRGALATLDEVVLGIIARRRQQQTEGNDLLALLMAAQDADTGERMTDAQLRDEVMTLFLAGHETTANLLAWTWHLLSRHPEVEARARAEVEQVLGDRPPGAQDVPRLRYLTQVLEESMRLYPPAWIFARQPIQEDEVAGFRLPASPRVIVVMSPWAIHRQPHLWPEPERFDPERFSPERSAGRHRMAFVPFGGGQRLCIGNSFAMMEAVLIAALVLRRFRLRTVPGHEVVPEPLVTLRPRGGLPMHLHPLHPSA
jgi:cytochrome P450